MEEVFAYYRSQIEYLQHAISVETKKIYRIGSVRLFLFVTGIACIIYFNHQLAWALIVACLIFIPFFLLIKVHNHLFEKKEYLEQKLRVNQQEIKALDYDPSDFDGGNDLIDTSHPYTNDLDIFGEKSLFQYINRTVTNFGRRILTSYFTCPYDTKKDIYRRQQTLQELKEKTSFREDFRTIGLLYKGKDNDSEELMKWNKADNYFEKRKYYSSIKWMAPFINFTLITLCLCNIVSYIVPCLSICIFIILSIGFSRYITKEQVCFDKKLKILHIYGRLLSLIENEPFESNELKELKESLKQDDTTAMEAIIKLRRRMDALDQRNNIFVTAILNGLFFWELHQIIRIESWKIKYGSYLHQWIDVIGKMDALCSLSNYVFNNPSYTYPTISEEPAYQAEGLRHPLMKRKTCIPNNIDMRGTPCFNIITGANMAGKSTYLRTVGINYMMGCMGLPVDAVRMHFYPAHLVTSLRTNDSLNENESYFFAEVKRLKMILDKLKSGEHLFIILDEILRGTNSVDKQKGSYSFIKQLMLHNATGLIATHDLQLAKLKESFPDAISTQCFEADIVDNELIFSYVLRDGVAQNMNACFLMEKMGIRIDEIEK